MDTGLLNMTNFNPSVENGRVFRKALGRFGTGVTVVTTSTPEGPLGMTANSFSSVSMDPPLVLWSPSKFSKRYPHFERASHFAIHVLTTDQAEICNGFAKSSNAFDGLNWHFNDQNIPLIDGCLARFECQKSACHEGGDHMIMVGQVERAALSDGSPLMFFGGNFGSFGSLDQAS